MQTYKRVKIAHGRGAMSPVCSSSGIPKKPTRTLAYTNAIYSIYIYIYACVCVCVFDDHMMHANVFTLINRIIYYLILEQIGNAQVYN